jgi:hypothetical protein
MYGQLDLEAISKFLKEIEKTSSFHGFLCEEIYHENRPPKNKLMKEFEFYDIVYPME